ncbi:hypothetical protein ASE74_12450 [Pedobacter sp. Leaf216]|uniref:DUF4099 domain-containing protein n=1 Tax=Pedobacter sp. Leaf216 TaxID=1735684 RepID=UPI0006FB9AE9|nr:DUF4099 domain-containing protein [Pedobacter sp. Leaf216]KQM63970.1 hypothetical protein ASE74_12450 [Pedobacter sp. Leaf216]
MKTLFNAGELPTSQLEKLGIYHQGQLLLDPHNIRALLSGRRTELLSLRGIHWENFNIERLDAKLSLFRNDLGEAEVLIHPIYKEVRKHPLLSEEEMTRLAAGECDYIGKSIQKEEGHYSMLNIEYDPQTKEFITYDVSKVQSPDLINGMLLSPEEKSAFSRGELLTLSDGTQLRHRASEPLGLLSDRKALILSVLLDGGISYLLLRGIRSLNQREAQIDYATPAFNSAYRDMEGQGSVKQEKYVLPQNLFNPAPERSKGISR